MKLHVRPQSVKPQHNTKSAIKTAIIFLAIFLPGLSVSFAQQLHIRNEAAFEGPRYDTGTHSVIVNSKGEVVVTGIRVGNTPAVKNFQVTILDRQLQQLSQWLVPTNNFITSSEDIIETADGGYIIIGQVQTTRSLNPPDYDPDILISKISATGALQWEKTVGGTGYEEAGGVQQTADGGYLIFGTTESNDLGIQNPTGKPQFWLTKLDAGGNTLWSKLLTTQYVNFARDFAKTKDGNYVVCGISTDYPSGTYSPMPQDALLIKFNDQGVIVWERRIGGNREEVFSNIAVDASGAIFVAGYTSSTDLPGLQNHGESDGWITKVSNDGAILSIKLFGGSGYDQLTSIAVSPTGVVTAGGVTNSTDFDLIDNVHRYSIWAINYRDGSNSAKHGFFGYGSGATFGLEDIALDANSNIYCVATTDSNNVFMRKPISGSDGWVFNIAESNLVKGSVFVDLNNNGTKDANEKVFIGGKLEVIKTNDPTRTEYFSSRNGEFVANIDTGAYTVRFINDQPYYTVSPSERSVAFPVYVMTDSFTVRLVPSAVKHDLAVSITPLNIPRPGFDVSYAITVVNRGTAVANNPVVQLVKDPRLTIVSAVPAMSAFNQDIISWNIGLLSPLDSVHIRLNMRIAAPPSTAIGDTLVSELSVQSDQGDETPLDNVIVLSELVAGSYDPNDKTEFHAGLFPVNMLATDKLYYLVGFQNTGNDTAFNIVIRDTLHSGIDVSGFQMIAASHPYRYTIKNGNQLEWTFENILLADSNRNEKASHGFVAFSVKPKSSLVVGDVITNKASIYFDYNLPVVTNTTSTQIADLPAVLPKPAITGLKTNYCGNDQAQPIKIINISATGGATISVKLNGTVINVDNTGSFLIDPTKMLIGNQNIEITFSKGGTLSTLNVSFKVTAPVKPVVKLTSNVVVVNNNTTAIQFTATAIAGGGNSPLYTFSTDRNMSGILQTEGSSNTLIASSQILSEGDNWIYLRMKTSDLCVTSNTATDSIKIVRNAVTGIVDVDFPRSIITAYPNPFRSDVTIQGLQASGHYMIQLINSVGNVVRTQDVQRKTSITFYYLNINSGIYFIRLYDKKKNRWVGSMPVIGL